MTVKIIQIINDVVIKNETSFILHSCFVCKICRDQKNRREDDFVMLHRCRKVRQQTGLKLETGQERVRQVRQRTGETGQERMGETGGTHNKSESGGSLTQVISSPPVSFLMALDLSKRR